MDSNSNIHDPMTASLLDLAHLRTLEALPCLEDPLIAQDAENVISTLAKVLQEIKDLVKSTRQSAAAAQSATQTYRCDDLIRPGHAMSSVLDDRQIMLPEMIMFPGGVDGCHHLRSMADEFVIRIRHRNTGPAARL